MPEVLHELDLPCGVPGAGGEEGGSDALGSVVNAETAGEETVTVAVLEHVLPSHTERGHASGEGLGPVLEILFGVTDDGGLAGGSGGDVYADELVVRSYEQTVGIVVAEVALPHEGDLAEGFEGGDVVRGQTGLLHATPEEVRLLVHLADLLLQKVELHLLKLLTGHRLDLLVPERHHSTLLCAIS